MNISQKPGLYVHIPFCESKCGYCDFYSIEGLDQVPSFIDSLHNEITLIAGKIDSNSVFDTIYIGGGTPSLLTVAQIESILKVLSSTFKISPDCELTLEANPGSISLSKLKELREIGINRLSIGIQSFHDAELKFLERIHDVKDGFAAIEMARGAGYDNIATDLIFAIPGQSLDDWIYSLNGILELQPEHIAAYNLTFEEGTPFFKRMKAGEISLVPEKAEEQYFSASHEILEKAGYLHYEVSNFALSEAHFSRHNYKYWEHTPYCGFGPSAHSFWDNERWGNIRSVSEYVARLKKGSLPNSFREKLSIKQLIFEHIFLSLRTFQGLNIERFSKRFHLDFLNEYATQIDKLLNMKLAVSRDGFFRLTNKGMLICDEILPYFSKN